VSWSPGKQIQRHAIYTNYVDAHEEQLTRLYELVETEFSSFYRKINSDDESSFWASLKPSAGKLDMEVDFYNLGMFPPLAYHSEGHQDGMGVCLYLALMKHLLGADFRLAVLDDVVMSVDSNHRKEFCTLLRDEFGSVQFIITTHEQYWAMQMMHAGLVIRRVKLTSSDGLLTLDLRLSKLTSGTRSRLLWVGMTSRRPPRHFAETWKR
jgi:hypothetical protein